MGHRPDRTLGSCAVFAAVVGGVACGTSQPSVNGASSCGAPVVWSRVSGSPGGFAIAGSGPHDIWLLASSSVHGIPSYPVGVVMEGDGAAWRVVPGTGLGDAQGNPNATAGALWVVRADEVFVGDVSLNSGEGAVGRWDGIRWTTYAVDDNRTVTRFWGSGPDDVWGTDSAYVGHWDGRSWTHIDSVHGGPIAGGAPMNWWQSLPLCAAQSRSGEPYCEADAALCISFQHHAASGMYDDPVSLSTCVSGNVYAAWASATDDVWFVGDGAFHFDGVGWRDVPTPAKSPLLGVWGTSKTDVWAVGEAGTIVHFDGAKWSSIASPTPGDLVAVWASGPCDAWAIGDAVYHGHPE